MKTKEMSRPVLRFTLFFYGRDRVSAVQHKTAQVRSFVFMALRLCLRFLQGNKFIFPLVGSYFSVIYLLTPLLLLPTSYVPLQMRKKLFFRSLEEPRRGCGRYHAVLACQLGQVYYLRYL